MAVVTVGPNGIPGGQISFGGLLNYTYVVYALDAVIFNDDPDNFTGFIVDNFRFKPSGQITGGTITDIAQMSNGVVSYEITGVSYGAKTLYDLVVRGQADAALPFIFIGDDDFFGSDVADHLSGYAGADYMFGYGGDDTLDGGTGDDWLVGGDGADSLNGGDGLDELDGGAGDDTLNGGAGANLLFGDDGNDTLNGGDGADQMFGGADNDNIYANSGDLVDGGDAGDHVDLSVSNVSVSPFLWASSVGQTLSDGTIIRNVESFVVRGTNLTLEGPYPNAPVYSPLNYVEFNGTLTLDFSLSTLSVNTIAASALQNNIKLGGPLGEIWLCVRGGGSYHVTGSAFDDDLAGAGVADNLNGGDGNDMLRGYSGADILSGDAGDDVLDGGDGNDILAGGAGDDILNGGGSFDTTHDAASYASAASAVTVDLSIAGPQAVGGGQDSDTLISIEDVIGSAFADTFTGDANANTFTGLAGNDAYYVGAGDIIVEALYGGTDSAFSDVTYTIGANVENLTLTGSAAINGAGNASANVLIGNSGVNTLDGGAGDDRLDGNGGGDTLIGGAGNDTFVVHGGDIITEAANGGVDTIIIDADMFGAAAYTLGANLENLTITGSTAFAATGNALANVLRGDGNSAIDTLTGNGGNDTYYVGAGDIVIELAGKTGGIDTVVSDASFILSDPLIENLTLLAGAGNISATGNGLANVLTGNEGNNVLSGLAGNDTLNGGAGNDTLDGGAGIDVMTGGDGDDIYYVDIASDKVIEVAGLGSGLDTIISSITLTLNTAALANVENLTLTGNAALSATGNALNNILTGNDADNVLKGGAGDDRLDGGLGNDTADYSAATSGVSVDLSIGAAQLVSASEGSDTLLNVERLIGSNYNDALTGDANANTLTGNGGDDVLDGGAGADALNGGAGNDTYVVDDLRDVVTDLAKKGGTDTVRSSVDFNLNSVLENLTLTGSGLSGIGNASANTLVSLGGHNALAGGAGADTYVVGDGDTVTEVGGKTGGVDLVQSSVSFVLGDFIENLTLTGTAAIDGTGNGLANILRGNAGINHLAGGDGADTYYVGAEDFVIEANATGGVDIVYASGSFALGANVENLTLVAGAGNIDGAGNSLANILTGNEGNNRLDGGAGIDTMTGGLGNDVYVVDSLSDKIVESAAISGGVDTIESSITYSIAAKALAGIENLTLTGTGDFNATGNGLANTLTGNTGANILDGGAGNDALNGGDGNDTLIGGIGADTLTGGLGADDFVLNAAAIYDTITDFSAADGDQIQLENAVFKALGATNNVPLADVQFHIGAAATDQFQHIIYNETTGALYYDADGSGAGAMIQIAALAPAITIDHTNFMVI